MASGRTDRFRQIRHFRQTARRLFRHLDGPIRANRFADSHESPGSRESFQGSRTEPLFSESRFGGPKIANRRFEAIRANRSHVMKIPVLPFLVFVDFLVFFPARISLLF